MTLEHIAEFHAEFERIHPFGDGNGRIGRLIMAFQCIQNDMIPPLIESKYRSEYLDNLYKAQTSNNFTQLSKFLEFCQNRSLNLIDKNNTLSLDEKIIKIDNAKAQLESEAHISEHNKVKQIDEQINNTKNGSEADSYKPRKF